MRAVCVQMYLVGLSHCVVRVMWFRYCILPEAVLLSSQLFHDRLRQTGEKEKSIVRVTTLKPAIILTHQVSHCRTGDCSPPPALLSQCDLWTEDLLHS